MFFKKIITKDQNNNEIINWITAETLEYKDGDKIIVCDKNNIKNNKNFKWYKTQPREYLTWKKQQENE